MSAPGRTGGSAGGVPTKPRCAADAGAPDRRQVRQGPARAERRAVTAGRKTRPPAGRRAAGRLDGAAARQRPKPGIWRGRLGRQTSPLGHHHHHQAGCPATGMGRLVPGGVAGRRRAPVRFTLYVRQVAGVYRSPEGVAVLTAISARLILPDLRFRYGRRLLPGAVNLPVHRPVPTNIPAACHQGS